MSKRTLKGITNKLHKNFTNIVIRPPKVINERNIITVSAEIADSYICKPDLNGHLHQHFYIRLKEVLDGDKTLVDNNMIFVAVHYGDEDGLKDPLPHLVPGSPIIIRGKFVPARKAYKTDDNPGYPVLHFTHHPVGYIEYEGIRYQ